MDKKILTFIFLGKIENVQKLFWSSFDCFQGRSNDIVWTTIQQNKGSLIDLIRNNPAYFIGQEVVRSSDKLSAMGDVWNCSHLHLKQ